MNVLGMVSGLWELLVRVPMVLISIVIHELSHGFAAYKMGDTTAKDAGRLSLNPVKHIDPVGAISMLLFRFGWAKPVPINPYRFKNKKAGLLIVSLAGPAANVIFAFFLMLILYFINALLPLWVSNANVLAAIGTTTYYLEDLYLLNLSLAVFNLIPIPPLDGSKVVGAFLPEDKFRTLMQYENIGMVVLLFLIAFSSRIDVLGRILSFGVTSLNAGIYQLVSLIFYFC